MVGVSFAIFRGIGKDTRDNILETKTFTVNIISEPFVEAANACSVEAPARIDEWLVSGLTPEASVSLYHTHRETHSFRILITVQRRHMSNLLE